MAHTYTSILIHGIFSTKERHPWITPDIRDRLYSFIGGIARAENCVLLSAGGAPDHIHTLLSLHPTVAPANLIRDIKANSSRWVHENVPKLGGFGWQTGYGGFSVSASKADDVRVYLARQEEHHRTVTFKEEYIEFLERHGVEYDPRYVFD